MNGWGGRACVSSALLAYKRPSPNRLRRKAPTHKRRANTGNYDPSSIYQLETRGEGAIGLSVRSAADQKTRSSRVPFAGDFLRRRERFGQIDAARSDRGGRQIGHGRR